MSSNIIKIKRGSGTPVAGSLAPFELAWNYTDKQLYIGTEDNDVQLVTDSAVLYSKAVELTGAVVGSASTDPATGKITVDVNWGASDTDASFGGGISVDGTSSLNGNVNVAGDATFNGNVTIEGDLTVHGTTTTVNSEVVAVDDPVFTLGTSSTQTVNDRGIELLYNPDGSTPKSGFFGFNYETGRFIFIPDATRALDENDVPLEIFEGNDGDFQVGNVYQLIDGDYVNVSDRWNSIYNAFVPGLTAEQNQILMYNATTSQWEPTFTLDGGSY